MWKPLKQETIQALLTEARYLDEKPAERHRMDNWSCGTTSCAVGDMMYRGDCGMTVAWCDIWEMDFVQYGSLGGWEAVAAALGITLYECTFLFEDKDSAGDRTHEPPSSTAARIRKYLYYRMRKAEILADYESARRVEGNLNVCQQAVEYAGAK